MGGHSSSDQTQTQTQQTTPWGPAQGVLSGILGKLGNQSTDLTGSEDAALKGLYGNAGFMQSNFGNAGKDLANTLLAGGGPDRTGMVNDAYQQYQKALTPFASGQYVDPASNPALQKYMSTIADDVSNRVNGQFAGAGRDLSGMNQQTLARGISQGEAPVMLDAYNQALGQQRSAIDSLYGAGGQTAGLLSQFDQQRLGNQQAGMGVADQVGQWSNSPFQQQLAAEAARRGIPMQALAQQMGIVLPAGQAFGTQSGTSTGTSTTQNPWWAPLGAIGSLGNLWPRTSGSGNK